MFGSIFINDSDAIRSLNNVDKKAQSTSAKLGEMAKKVASWGKSIALMGATAAAGIAVEAIRNTVALGDQLMDLNAKTGISISQLQSLKYVSEQTGANFESVTQSVGRLIRSMAAADKGTKAQVESFQKLGVSIYDATGNLKSTDEFLPEVLRSLSEVGNETERDAIAMDIFGRSALELAPLMQQGENSIDALTQKFRELGLEISEDTIRAADKFADSMKTLRAAFTAIFAEIATELLPALQSIVDFVIENKDVFIGIAGAIADSLKAIIIVIDGIIDGLKRLANYEEWLQGKNEEYFNSMKNTMLDYGKEVYDEQKKILDDSIDLNQNALDKKLTAINDAYDKEIAGASNVESKLRKNLDNQSRAYDKAHRKRMDMMDEEYKRSIGLIDDETEKKVNAIEAEIDAIDEKEEADKIADLQNKIAKTRNFTRRQEYIKELAELEKQDRIDNLNDEKDKILESASNQKDALQEEYEKKKKIEEDKYDATKESFDKQRDALDGYSESYIARLKVERDAKIKAETKKLQATVDALKKEREQLKKHYEEQNKTIEKNYSIQLKSAKYFEYQKEIQRLEFEIKSTMPGTAASIPTINRYNQLKAEFEKFKQGLPEGAYGAFASGTNYVPITGQYLVGERGPEKVMLPQGSKVIPNEKLSASPAVSININNPYIMDDYGVNKLLDRMMQRLRVLGVYPK